MVKSFARIHRSNLVNAGILPLTFKDETDYDKISQGDNLSIENIRESIVSGAPLVVKNLTTGDSYEAVYDLSGRAKEIILAGGLLNYTKAQN